MQTGDLLADLAAGEREALGTCSCILRGHALPHAKALLAALEDIERLAPFRHQRTPGGHTMSVAITNCGAWGWTSDASGYRYRREDPLSQQPWPALPPLLSQLAQEAAALAGFNGFIPDACLINRYGRGARMSLHQDSDEQDLGAPIVSVSLGMSARFQFGGLKRGDPTAKTPLYHGDVAVWGGADRLRFHGILPLNAAPHPTLGDQRINLTFRKAGR